MLGRRDPDPIPAPPGGAVEPSLTMYTTTWCGYCTRLKRALAREGIPYREVDVDTDPEAAALVEYVNGGYRTVPTLVFDDDEVLVNPSVAEVRAHLDRPAGQARVPSD